MNNNNVKRNLPAHVILPSDRVDMVVRPIDIGVYIVMREYENYKSHDTYVSTNTISEVTGIERHSVSKCLKNLITDGYIESKPSRGRLTLYKFLPCAKFEGVDKRLIDNPDLPVVIKGYIAMATKYMFIDNTNLVGYIKMKPEELAKKLNVSRATLFRYNKYLNDNGYLKVKTNSLYEKREVALRDDRYDYSHYMMEYNLPSMGDAVVFLLHGYAATVLKIQDQERRLDELSKKMALFEQKQIITNP